MAYSVRLPLGEMNRIITEQNADLLEWLDQNENPDMLWDEDRTHCTLIFQSEGQAVTFKLRWCGQ